VGAQATSLFTDSEQHYNLTRSPFFAAFLLHKIERRASFHFSPGLPDGFFSNQKSQFWLIFESLRWQNIDTFHGYLEYFTDI
jgi:sugar lactone lactonase YvrE